jgi:hypothetical protein
MELNELMEGDWVEFVFNAGQVDVKRLADQVVTVDVGGQFVKTFCGHTVPFHCVTWVEKFA